MVPDTANVNNNVVASSGGMFLALAMSCPDRTS